MIYVLQVFVSISFWPLGTISNACIMFVDQFRQSVDLYSSPNSRLQARRALRSSRPQSASCNILAHRSPHACFYLILATLNYFNLSSVFILHYHAFNPLPIFFFSCLILTDAALTCLKCLRGRVAVLRDR